jgi:hypothetical protein
MSVCKHVKSFPSSKKTSEIVLKWSRFLKTERDETIFELLYELTELAPETILLAIDYLHDLPEYFTLDTLDLPCRSTIRPLRNGHVAAIVHSPIPSFCLWDEHLALVRTTPIVQLLDYCFVTWTEVGRSSLLAWIDSTVCFLWDYASGWLSDPIPTEIEGIGPFQPCGRREALDGPFIFSTSEIRGTATFDLSSKKFRLLSLFPKELRPHALGLSMARSQFGQRFRLENGQWTELESIELSDLESLPGTDYEYAFHRTHGDHVNIYDTDGKLRWNFPAEQCAQVHVGLDPCFLLMRNNWRETEWTIIDVFTGESTRFSLPESPPLNFYVSAGHLAICLTSENETQILRFK